MDGINLQELVRKGGDLDVPRATHYIGHAALGLEHAHKNGLVHRDIKPSNIMVDRTGIVKILDMGLARFARFSRNEEDILTRKYDGNVLGTPDYLAPEQAEDPHAVDIRADIYSLGATFYFCLTGSPPFGQGTLFQKITRHQFRPPPPVRDHRPDVPMGLEAVITKMLAKDPADRYQRAAEVHTALELWNYTPIILPTEHEMPGLSPTEQEMPSLSPAAVNRLVESFRKAAPEPSSPEQAIPKLPVRSDAKPWRDISNDQPTPVALSGGNESPRRAANVATVSLYTIVPRMAAWRS